MWEAKDISREIISAWGADFSNYVNNMILYGLSEMSPKPKKHKGIPTLTGRISKIKSK